MLIFDRCYEVHFGPNWLLKFDSPPQLVIRSIDTTPKHLMGLNIPCKTLKGSEIGILQITTSMP